MPKTVFTALNNSAIFCGGICMLVRAASAALLLPLFMRFNHINF
ncbi:putative membrane protein [Vibrio parahaemolyticus VPTS-2010_2]|nr:putative membrane protein [Vibrio parahaemolyticus 50]EXJ46785.1 putative membrane protein [Vibrio parahaemolyticus VPTS-2010_2]